MTIQCETFYFDSANGENKVFVRRWLPATLPRATLLIAHGMAEHGGRYEEFATFLAEQGFIVTAHDHIGHGLSINPGQRYGYLAGENGWASACADMEYLRALQQKQHPQLPCFMLGHSMGSFLLRNYLIDYAPTQLSGAILSGVGQVAALPLMLGGVVIKFEEKRIGAKGLSFLIYMVIQGGYNRHFKPRRTKVDWLTRDTAMVDSYLADALCRKIPTVGLYRDVQVAQKYTANRNNLQRMNKSLPLLFISGSEDPVGHNGRAVNWLYRTFAAVGCKDMRFKLYEGGRHAMLYELNRAQVYADIAAWLNEKLSEKESRL